MKQLWQKFAAVMLVTVFGFVSLAAGCLNCSELIPQGSSKRHCCNPKGHCEKPGTQQDDHTDCSAKPTDPAKIETIAQPAMLAESAILPVVGLSLPLTLQANSSSPVLPPDDPLRLLSQLRL